MNFIAASLLYHAGEVGAFWLLIALMDQYKMKEVFKINLPGLRVHDRIIEKLGRKYHHHLFSHFVSIHL